MAHRNKYIIEAMIIGLYGGENNDEWCGMPGRVIVIDDEAINIDEYAAEFGFTLPDSE